MAFPKLPPILREIADHARPALSTDDSYSIPKAAAAHDAELDREADEGAAPLAPATGPTAGEEQAGADLDASIAAERARLGLLSAT